MTFGALGFLSPWILSGLVALPVIWWLLRFTPPRPKQIWFPPTRLLLELESEEQTAEHSPWWLTALRILLAGLLIFALSQPVLNPDRTSLNSDSTMLLIVDNGWAAAPMWEERQSLMDSLIDQAERNSQPVILASTAQSGAAWKLVPETAKKARERADGLQPQPYDPDRSRFLDRLEQSLDNNSDLSIVWLNDGLDYGAAKEFGERLAKLDKNNRGITVFQNPDRNALGVRLDGNNSDSMNVEVIRAGGGAVSGLITARSGRGAQLGETPFSFEGYQTTAKASIKLPLEIRNQVAELRIETETSAGAIHLLDSRSHRRRVGLISGESRENSQPLLSPLYYIERAILPYSEILTARESNVATSVNTLLENNPSVIVLADIGKIVSGTSEKIESWLSKGGVLVRFAGPRLEKDTDNLLPVILRQGGRVLGGALSWSTPQSLAPFEDTSLFYGLEIADDVNVSRQVLADPINRSESTLIWARLSDGTPLVTAQKRGQGWIILFHVTANSDWSNLPLSGLFVNMLRRIIDFSANLTPPVSSAKAEGSPEVNENLKPLELQTQLLSPIQTLDGFGRLSSPPSTAETIDIAKIAEIKPSAKHPPGFYGPPGSVRTINVIDQKTELKLLTELPTGAQIKSYERGESVNLKPWLLLAALALFILDAIIVFIMAGGFNKFKSVPSFGTTTSLVTILTFTLLLGMTQSAHSQQDDFALKSALDTRLAYVVTGDARIDTISEQGLSGLSRVLKARTAIEPETPMPVNIDNDELSFFPILYWPVNSDSEALSEATLAKIDAYMKQGGMIIFDTQDFQQRMPLGTVGEQDPGTVALQRIIGRLDIPRLEPVPEGHVLTKSFYLLRNFPGRWDGGALWVEARPSSDQEGQERASSRTDGVSSILITSNDFSAAWALDDQNRPIYPTVPGGENQREMAFRTGVNIVMYALTGNYKADQVHVPALLERLGQ